MKLFPILFLFLVCASTGCFKKSPPSVAITPQSTLPVPIAIERPVTPWPSPLPYPADLESARRQREALEQSPPDARFLMALSDIDSLMSQRPRQPVVARLSNGRWQILFRGQQVADVSPFPDYHELSSTLVLFARQLSASVQSSSAAAALPAPDVILLDQAAEQEAAHVNKRWASGDRSTEVITRAAHLLTSIVVEMNDTMGVADNVMARAWALLSLAQASNIGSGEDEALLASVLGYTKAAKALASSLASDAVRAYVNGDLQTLDKLAARSDASTGARYLRLRMLVERGPKPELLSAAESIPSDAPLSTIRALARSNTFELKRRFPSLLVEQELRALKRRVDQSSVLAALARNDHGAGTLPNLERAIQALPVSEKVPFDSMVEGMATRARVFSAARAMFEFGLNSRAVKTEAEHVIEMLGVAEGVSGQFRDWLTRYLNLGQPTGRSNVYQAMAAGWDQLGADALSQIMLLTDYIRSPGEPLVLESIQYFQRRADSRPSHIVGLYRLVQEGGIDLGLIERSVTRWIALTGDVTAQSWLDAANGDLSQVERVSADVTMSPERRTQAISRLHSAKRLSEDEAFTRLNALWQATGSDHVFKSLLDFADDNYRYKDLAELLEPWLKQHDQDDSMSALNLRSMLARAYRYLGRPKDALRVVEPILDSWMQSVMYEASLAHLALGHRNEGLKIARDMFERYPGGASTIAAVYWRAGMYSEAAAAIKGKLNYAGLNEYFPQTVIAFARLASAKEMDAVLQSLVVSETRANVAAIASGLSRYRRPDLGGQLLQKLPARTIEEDLNIYRMISYARGEATAAEWFWKNRSPEKTPAFPKLLILWSADALLFDPGYPSLQGSFEEATWAARAMSLARKRVQAGDQWELVRNHYAQTSTSDGADSLTLMLPRYLMGFESKENLVAQAKSRQDMTRVGYYLGLAEAAAGHIDSAANHYLDVVDLRASSEEAQAAGQTLKTWARSERTLKRIAAEKPATP